MRDAPTKPTPTLLVRWWPDSTWAPDIPGELRVADTETPGRNGELLWGHVSSSLSWLERDLLHNFGRAEQLAERFPDGFEVQWVPERPGDVGA